MKLTSLLWLVLSTGCGGPSQPAPSPQPEAMPKVITVEPAQPDTLQEVPALPAHTVLQVFCRDSGHLERFMDDGRWLVQEPGGELAPRAPMSVYEPDHDALSGDALRRIRETLVEVDFFELPPRLEGTMPGPGVLLPGGQGAPQALVYVFSAFDEDGLPHSVELEGEIRAFGTFGALHPLVQSLDREAWGRWRNE
jgi:hypothetical protein